MRSSILALAIATSFIVTFVGGETALAMSEPCLLLETLGDATLQVLPEQEKQEQLTKLISKYNSQHSDFHWAFYRANDLVRTEFLRILYLTSTEHAHEFVRNHLGIGSTKFYFDRGLRTGILANLYALADPEVGLPKDQRLSIASLLILDEEVVATLSESKKSPAKKLGEVLNGADKRSLIEMIEKEDQEVVKEKKKALLPPEFFLHKIESAPRGNFIWRNEDIFIGMMRTREWMHDAHLLAALKVYLRFRMGKREKSDQIYANQYRKSMEKFLVEDFGAYFKADAAGAKDLLDYYCQELIPIDVNKVRHLSYFLSHYATLINQPHWLPMVAAYGAKDVVDLRHRKFEGEDIMLPSLGPIIRELKEKHPRVLAALIPAIRYVFTTPAKKPTEPQ